ncbi:MAG: uL15 family ribosomal protein, partial [Pseudonocardiaceae bacterium]
GQKSRSGFSRLRGFEGGQMPLHRRLPKRGFTNIFKKEPAVVNVSDLERFANGATVDEAALAEAGLVELGMSVSVQHVGDGSPDDAFYRMSMAQLRSGLVGRGLLSEDQYTAGIAPLDDPAVLDALFANVAAWGRRPPS